MNLQRQLVNKGKDYEGFYHVPEISPYKISQNRAHLKDVELLTEKISELFQSIGVKFEIKTEQPKALSYRVNIQVDKESDILNELGKHGIEVENGRIIPFIPEWILKSHDTKIIGSFLRGYCDLRSRIVVADGIYKKMNGKRKISKLRLGISLSHKHPELIEDFRSLFRKLGIEKQVYFSNPKHRDRELLIRIDVRAVPKDLVGTHWRKIFLTDFKNFMLQGKENN